MADLPSTSLTNTLVLALSQCQEQIRTIQKHSNRIDQLQQENERLRRELQDVREKEKAKAKAAEEELNQTQDLFQKHVEAQAEIRSLKKKVRSYKEKASKRLSMPLSSPLASPITPLQPSSKESTGKRVFSEVLNASSPPTERARPAEESGERRATEEVSEVMSSAPPSKRAKPDSGTRRDALKEVSTNSTHPRPSSPSVSKRGTVLQKIAAIPSLAEDGEEHAPTGKTANPERSAVSRDDSMYHRLDGLLAGSTPVKPVLARPRSRSPRPLESHSKSNPRKPLNISNIQHTISEDTAVSTSLLQSNDTIAKLNGKLSKAEHNTALTTPSNKEERSTSSFRRSARAAKVLTPLRKQPVDNLILTSFKPNPRWLSSHNISFDDFLNDRQYERMRTLATTLPHLPGETRDHHFTDHELLLEFLGPDSEARIANLTPVARQNLIIEAKTRRVAQKFKFSKPAVDLDQEDGPPGFWSTDMPGTQEAEENRKESRRREREEVTRRYEDAMSGQGRWIFADE